MARLQISLSNGETPAKPERMFNGITKEKRKEIATLLNGLRREAAEALLVNNPLPEFDLCSISVPGTNLFCHGNKGMPRSVMPQLKGFPVPGSAADAMEKDKNGKVDVSQAFLDMLASQSISTRRDEVDPSTLKATQNQLVGAKIALNVGKMKNNPNHKKFTMPYFISKDGYVLDGHHGWASVLAYCLVNKTTAKINVIVIDLPIEELVKLANDFTRDIGIAQKAANAN